jgi:hypothetical protein
MQDNNNQKADPLGEMKRFFAPYLLILFILCGLLFFILDRISSNVENVPLKVKFSDVGPCLESSQDIIEHLVVGNAQYICANMEANQTNIMLALYVYRSEDIENVYDIRSTFSSGPIYFAITPALPPGKYLGKIGVFRNGPSIEFEFKVMEK